MPIPQVHVTSQTDLLSNQWSYRGLLSDYFFSAFSCLPEWSLSLCAVQSNDLPVLSLVNVLLTKEICFFILSVVVRWWASSP